MYDDIKLWAQDQEEKYFDSESPEVMENCEQEGSEDELDIYMKYLSVE